MEGEQTWHINVLFHSKKEDQWYRDKIDNLFSASDIINKGLDRVIDSNDGDYIMKTIRQDYLKDSTVTVFLIGTHSAENGGCDYLGRRKNYFIERELQASLFNGEGNTRNGIWMLFSLRCVIKSTRELTNAKNVMERIVMLLLMTRQ